MALSNFQRTIVDDAGNVIPNATVTVRVNDSTGALANLFTDRAGTTPASNPISADGEGFVRFYVAGGRYYIKAEGASSSIEWEDYLIGTMQGQDSGAVAVTGGSINDTTVGATTPNTGAFTTLAASGNSTIGGTLGVTGAITATGGVSGAVTSSSATITGGSINGTTVGATTASTGAFTTLAASGNSTIGGTLGVTGRATFGGTDGVVIPVGTTAQRSGSPVTGLARLNTSLGLMEYYDGTVWRAFSEQLIEVGTPMGGGFFAGYISTSANGVPTHYLIVAPKSGGETSATYGPLNRPDPTSVIDGPANTATLVATGDAPAAQFCDGLTLGGFTDWYMPALNELDVLYFSFKPTTANNTTGSGVNDHAVPKRGANMTAEGPPRQTKAAQFRDGNTEFFRLPGFAYISSTQFDDFLSRTYEFNTGARGTAAKTVGFLVRAVRRIAI